MKIVSWNCRYGLTDEKMDSLKKFCNNVDVYALQEVKENDVINRDYFKYRHWYGDHAEFGDCHVPRANTGDLGIAIFSNTYKIERIDEGRERFRYVLPYKLMNDKEEFILINIWTKSFPEYYSESIIPALQYYKEYLKGKPIVMIGDFNFGRTIDDIFFVEFDDEVNKISNLSKPIECIKKQNTDTYYSFDSKKYYFNDCLYFTKHWNLIAYKVGNRDEWIRIKNPNIKKFSDHCPIMAELELQ